MAKTRRHRRAADLSQAIATMPSYDLTDYVTTPQAAELLGMKTTSVNHLLHSGRLLGIKLGRDWLIYRSSVREYVRSKSSKGRPTSAQQRLTGE